MRYIVYGIFREIIAELCIEASSKDEAIAEWHKTFADKNLHIFHAMNIRVWNLDGEEAIFEEDAKNNHNITMWKGNGHIYYHDR